MWLKWGELNWGDNLLWLWFSFPWWLMMLRTFSYTCWLLEFLLCNTGIFSFVFFFFFFFFFYYCFVFFFCWFLKLDCISSFSLSRMSSLYILNVDSLSNISFANISSYSLGYLFILLMISFAVQELLILMQSHWYIFFCYLYLWCHVQKVIAKT